MAPLTSLLTRLLPLVDALPLGCAHAEQASGLLVAQPSHLASHAVSRVGRQAEQVRDQLLAQRAHWRLNGPVSDEHLKGMIEAITKAKTAASDGPDVSSSRGVVLDRRRLNEDSDDSDVSLTGL